MKTLQEIAFALDLAFDTPEGMEPYLDETAYHDTPNCTFPFGTHIAIVEIDEETGVVDLVRYIAVDDVGKKINPMIVDGQLHGGIAQGVGQALWEGAVYSDDGQLLTGSMLDYALPRASWLPSFELDETVTPSPGQPARGQGRRRGGLHREHRGGGQRGHRRAQPAGHPAPRHAVHRAEGLGRDPGRRTAAPQRQRLREGRPGMIPAEFGYTRAGSVDEALGAIAARRRREGHRGRPEPAAAAQAAAGVRRDAGRHRPARRAPRASSELDDGRLSVGALTTYAELMDSPAIHYGVLRDALPTIGDVQVRNRGTVGGAVAHADPASDLPAALLALDAEVILQSSARDADGQGRRLLRRAVPDGHAPRRAPDPDPAAGPARQRRVRVRLPRAAGLRLRDGRRRGGRRSSDRAT